MKTVPVVGYSHARLRSFGPQASEKIPMMCPLVYVVGSHVLPRMVHIALRPGTLSLKKTRTKLVTYTIVTAYHYSNNAILTQRFGGNVQ